MRETEGHGGAHTHTHSRKREREREREREGGGLTPFHMGHFGDIPCREVSVELIRITKH